MNAGVAVASRNVHGDSATLGTILRVLDPGRELRDEGDIAERRPGDRGNESLGR